MKVILISVAMIGIALSFIAIKILLKKGGKFSGTCSGNNPLFQGAGGSCAVCGSKPDELCKKNN